MADLPAPGPWRGLAPLHVLGMDISPLNGYVVRSRGLVEAQLDAGARPAVVLPPLPPRSRGEAEDAGWPLAERLVRIVHPAFVPRRGDEASGGRLEPGELPAGDPGDLVAATLYRLRRRIRGPGRGGASGGPPSSPASPSPIPALARPLLALEDHLLMRRLRRGLLAVAPLLAPDLVHAHSPHRSARPALAAARALRLPAVYEVRGLWEESAVAEGLWRRGSRPYRAWRRHETEAMRQAGAVVVIGEALRREVLSRGIPEGRVFVVPNAVGREFAVLGAAGGPDARASAAGDCTFGYVGSLRLLEGVEHLLRGVAASRRRGRDARALIVGGGGDLARLQGLASELGLGDHVVFTGARPHAEVASLYRRIDVFVVSRPDEVVCRLVPPLKPLEAMAMGLPVVASDLPALGEVVRPGENGLLVPPEDAEAFASAVEPLYDPAVRRRLGEQGQRWVLAERTWAAVLPELARAYASVLADRRAETVEEVEPSPQSL